MSRSARAGPTRRVRRWVPPAPGEEAEPDLREPDLTASRHQPDVAGQRELRPAAERVAVDGRDHGLLHGLEACLDVHPAAGSPLVLRREIPQHRDVGAGAEAPLPAGEDHGPHGAIGGQLRDRPQELVDHLEVDRVDRRPVECDGRNPAGPRDGQVATRVGHRGSSSGAWAPWAGRGRAGQTPQPPLTWMFAPVTYPASSDRRKRAAPTTSSTCPRCPAGMRSEQGVEIGTRVARRLEDARGHRVHGDAVRGQDLGQRPHQDEQAGLRDVVGGDVRLGRESVGRREAEPQDPPPAPRLHSRRRRLREEEERVEVLAEGLPPPVRRLLEERPLVVRPRPVHEGVQTPPGRLHSRDERPRLGGVAEIRRERERRDSRGLDAGPGLLRRPRVRPERDGHGPALAREIERDAAGDAARRAGDERHPAGHQFRRPRSVCSALRASTSVGAARTAPSNSRSASHHRPCRRWIRPRFM